MRSTIPSLIESQPALPRTFRAFRTLKQAVSYIAKQDESRECKLRHVRYTSQDERYIVNMRGSNLKSRIKLTPKKVYVCSLHTALVGPIQS